MNIFRQAWAVLTGKICIPSNLESMHFMTAFAKTQTAFIDLQNATQRLLQKSQEDIAVHANALTDIANADTDMSQQLLGLTQQIDAIVPPPVVVDAAVHEELPAADHAITHDPVIVEPYTPPA